ncbi:hypothetical protein ASPVEDRAFT_158439 [Aspergillus versicolor CBS 583.65]|uniref:Lipocalin-like domain-containing protein n=1 Tax=Aspergillus versicolor CBS 583.65 TaxID=1036611 RepID=A0A1L9P5F2_ASPVE|nr:uncharacterized protein ASPVEDRAFT_158439 [Aspergillus versicolor CBS 583.65]OJI96761.1 hypothetical protein ASPVEDRAFT_158439 [Aspergillus versicolor CBS 583.65]
MVAPTDLNIQNLTGDWVVDKSKTKNMDAALKLQGIGWIRRKAVTSGTITLKIKQTTEPQDGGEPVTRLMIQQGLRSIFPGVEQTTALDWTEHKQVDAVSGAAIIVRSRFVRGVRDAGGQVKPVLDIQTTAGKREEIESYLGTAVSVPGGGGEDSSEKAFVQDFIRCPDGGWSAEQVWAVESIGDGLFLTCKAVAAKGSDTQEACLVYQYEQQ